MADATAAPAAAAPAAEAEEAGAAAGEALAAASELTAAATAAAPEEAAAAPPEDAEASAAPAAVPPGGAEAIATAAAPPLTPSSPSSSSLRSASVHARAGAHDEAIEEIDKYLKAFTAQGGVSIEAVQAATVTVRLCNELALGCMRDAATSEQLNSAYAYLKWALKAPHASPALRAVTLNNAGIYYARTGQPQAALRCLERVGQQGGAMFEDDVSVHVKLNMTTVLADLGRCGRSHRMAGRRRAAPQMTGGWLAPPRVVEWRPMMRDPFRATRRAWLERAAPPRLPAHACPV